MTEFWQNAWTKKCTDTDIDKMALRRFNEFALFRSKLERMTLTDRIRIKRARKNRGLKVVLSLHSIIDVELVVA